MNTKLKHKPISCQENFSDPTDSTPNIYELNREFLGNCTEFVNNIIDLENSPWGSSQSTIEWASKQSPNNIGKTQKEILLFLQRRYFIKGQPCFVKQSYIADQLNIHRSQVNRTLASLERNGIILRIQWLYKGRRKNCMLLPVIPSINPLFNIQNLPAADFQRCHIKCNTLFCKSVKSKQVPTSLLLYTNILYINKLFKYNLVTINTLNKRSNLKSLQTLQRSNEQSQCENAALIPVTGCGVNKSEKGTSIMPRFALKRKQRSGNPYPETSAKLKLNGYQLEKLPSQEQVDYINYLGFNHGIDIQQHFKIDPRKQYDNKAHWYTRFNFDLRQCLVRIIESGNELQWSFADNLIALWNETIKEYKQFRRINLKNKESKSYINATIAITHALIFRAGNDMERMRKAVLRLPKGRFGGKVPWRWKVVSLDKFFMMDVSSDKYTSNPYLYSDIEFKRFIYEYKQKNPKNAKAYDFFRKYYIQEYFNKNEENGYNACYQNEFLIRKFLDDLIDTIRDGANTYNFSLVLENNSNPSLLQLYFHYLNTTNLYDHKAAKFKTIVDIENWQRFVEKYMRIEMGYSDFWKKQLKN